MLDSDLEKQFRVAKGNWKDFDLPLQFVLEVAQSWQHQISGVEKPWLCWNVEPDWCLLQQKLVVRAGWTPLVGFDPRFPRPKVIEGAILIDFNEELKLPTLRPMFVVEFAFLFANRLAFWHSDLLLDEARMRHYANAFASLEDGEMVAVKTKGGGGLKKFLPMFHRYWELLGCTTRSASRDQFERGCGWWHHFYCHPNFKGRLLTNWERYDYGHGIAFWARHYGGKALPIRSSHIKDGHFTRIGRKKSYVVSEENNWFRNLNVDLKANFSLAECARQMNISHLIE